MRFLSIKNYAAHQHYKDRRPPWIKLHAAVLDDYAFGCLQDASKAHLMLLWVLASKLDNRIPWDEVWLAKQLGATEPVNIEVLVSHGFVIVEQDASTAIAARVQDAEPEAEREAETTSSHHTAREQFLAGLNGSRQAWEARLVAWQAGGMHSTGATEAEIDKALEEYLLNGYDAAKPNARLLESMIRKVITDRLRDAVPPAVRPASRDAAAEEAGEVAWGHVLSCIAQTPWRFLPRDSFDARAWKAIGRVGGLVAIAERDLKNEPFMKRDFIKNYASLPAAPSSDARSPATIGGANG